MSDPDPASELANTPATCRERATEFERLAGLPGIGTDRARLLSLAATWRDIADDIEAAARHYL